MHRNNCYKVCYFVTKLIIFNKVVIYNGGTKKIQLRQKNKKDL